MATTTQKWKDIKAAKMTPERKGRLDGEVKRELLEMSLRELRPGSETAPRRRSSARVSGDVVEAASAHKTPRDLGERDVEVRWTVDGCPRVAVPHARRVTP
jgi:hypothetical protein